MGLIDKLGGPETDPHYPMGWAMAGNAPLKRWKQDTHHGGNTDPLIISWPEGIKAKGKLRRQYTYVTDIFPTLARGDRPAGADLRQRGQADAAAWDEPRLHLRRPGRAEATEGPVLRDAGKPGRSGRTAGLPSPGTRRTTTGTPTSGNSTTPTSTSPRTTTSPPRCRRSSAELKALWFEREAKKYGVLPLGRTAATNAAADPARRRDNEKPAYDYYPHTSIVHPLTDAPQLLGRRSHDHGLRQRFRRRARTACWRAAAASSAAGRCSSRTDGCTTSIIT